MSDTNGTSMTGYHPAEVVAQLTGLRTRQLAALAEKGSVTRKREHDDGTGIWLYSIEECVALSPKDSLSGEQANIAAQRLVDTKAQNAFTLMTIKHLEDSWKMIHGPLLDVITELREDNKALRASALEGEQMRRQLENDAHTRKLAEEVFGREQARKDEMFAGAKKAAAHIWPDVKEALMGVSIMSRFRKTFDRTKIDALLAVPGMLSDEEAALLRRIFDIPEVKPEGAEPEVVETEGQET